MIWLLLFSSFVFGDCSSPAGKEGQFQYISQVYKFCDGNYWITLPADADSACTAPDNGKLRSNGTNFEFCSDFKGGWYWCTIANVVNLGGSCGTNQMSYDSTLKNPRAGFAGGCFMIRSKRRFFISTTTTAPNFGGLAAADAICQADAIAASREGTWIAWLSTSTVNAIDRILDNGPWLVGNSTNAVFSTKADINGNPLPFGINQRFDGTTDTTSSLWTGTNENGFSTGNNCTDWTVNTGVRFGGPYGTAGIAGSTTSTWTNNANPPCDTTTRRLLCVEL